MKNQFSRLELLIGEDAILRLYKKKIAVFGLGGVGGNVVDALARSGIVNFTLIDNDEITITNINRQLIANLDTIGRAKVDVMEEHLLSLNKDINVTKYKSFYLPGETFINLSGFDYVVDAIDTVSAKIDLIKRCNDLGVPIISALGCGNKLDPSKLEITTLDKTSYDPLAKVLRRELRKLGKYNCKVVYSKETPIDVIKNETYLEELNSSNKKNIPGSSAFVPPVAGIMIASEVIKDLLKKGREDL